MRGAKGHGPQNPQGFIIPAAATRVTPNWELWSLNVDLVGPGQKGMV